MRRFVFFMIVVLLFGASTGCVSFKKRLVMFGYGDIVFPNGTVLGGASADQARALAEILVESHNLQMKSLDEMRDRHRKTAEKALLIMEELSRSQGAGEITIFFQTGAASIANKSLEYNRLVRFADYVARESRGRLVHLVLIGSASSVGSRSVNQKLSEKRARAPVDIINKYLVNTPHEFYKIGGIGEMYSPRNVPEKVHGRYQHVRVIATYETNQLPELPEKF